MVKEITQEQYDECKIIVNKIRITTQEVAKMMSLFNQFIDAGAKCCGTCPTQIRFMHKIFKNWLVEVKIIDEKSHKCLNCDILIKDKRKKYCSENCRDLYRKINI